MEAVAEAKSSGDGGRGGSGRRCPFDFDEMENIGPGYFAMAEVAITPPHQPTQRCLAVRAFRCLSCGLIQLFDEISS